MDECNRKIFELKKREQGLAQEREEIKQEKLSMSFQWSDVSRQKSINEAKELHFKNIENERRDFRNKISELEGDVEKAREGAVGGIGGTVNSSRKRWRIRIGGYKSGQQPLAMRKKSWMRRDLR